MNRLTVVVLVPALLVVASCGTQAQPTAAPEEPALGMPNPASEFCVEQGYELEIRAEAGGEVGYCLFPDGTECEEWAYFRHECEPGDGTVQETPEPTEAGGAPARLPNPASQNCVDQGGTLSIESRPDGSEYGVCLFEGNRQCEEWALLRGECPPGGVKVTGFVTDAARFCAITGGEYTLTGKSGAADEEGTCTLADGTKCDVWAYFEGGCLAEQADSSWKTGESVEVTDSSVPLADALQELEPKDVWQNFYDLTQIPRPSRHEEQVRQFLVQFAQDLGLESAVDGAGNVLIRKPPSPGLEDVGGVVLQAHMDMVPQKAAGKVHDFSKDPIEAYVVGDWVTADGTTLGADDGIGIAMAMSVLQSDTLATGPIEVLFTVDEESSMSGAIGLEPGVLQGDTYINLDWETEGSFCIGAAGGEVVVVGGSYPEVETPAGMAAYRLRVHGLKGGHSGVNINMGRGHATELLIRLLQEASEDHGIRLAELAGGEVNNAITREATALLCVPEGASTAFLEGVGAFEDAMRAELGDADPGVKVEATATDLPPQVMQEETQATLLDALGATPQGVLAMSEAVPGLVETSTNIGVVKIGDGQILVQSFMRSSVDTGLDDVGQQIVSVWEPSGADVQFVGRFSGWNPDPDSPVLGLMKASYLDLFGSEAEVLAVHAGLECGEIGAKYPGIDMISIGPTLIDVHTPDERLQIVSVKMVNDLLIETLKRIAQR